MTIVLRAWAPKLLPFNFPLERDAGTGDSGDHVGRDYTETERNRLNRTFSRFRPKKPRFGNRMETEPETDQTDPLFRRYMPLADFVAKRE